MAAGGSTSCICTWCSLSHIIAGPHYGKNRMWQKEQDGILRSDCNAHYILSSPHSPFHSRGNQLAREAHSRRVWHLLPTITEENLVRLDQWPGPAHQSEPQQRSWLRYPWAGFLTLRHCLLWQRLIGVSHWEWKCCVAHGTQVIYSMKQDLEHRCMAHN